MSWNLEEAIGYYQKQGAPGDHSACISLLKEIQRECGGSIPAYIPEQLAQRLGVKESYFLALIKRIPALRLGDAHVLELCAGPNCGRHRALAAAAEALAREKGFVLRFVPCMRMCGKGPNIRWDGKLHHQATEALLERLTEGAGL